MDIKSLYNSFTNEEKRKVYNMYQNYKLRLNYAGYLPQSFKEWILSYSDYPLILKSIAYAKTKE